MDVEDYGRLMPNARMSDELYDQHQIDFTVFVCFSYMSVYC